MQYTKKQLDEMGISIICRTTLILSNALDIDSIVFEKGTAIYKKSNKPTKTKGGYIFKRTFLSNLVVERALEIIEFLDINCISISDLFDLCNFYESQFANFPMLIKYDQYCFLVAPSTGKSTTKFTDE